MSLKWEKDTLTPGLQKLMPRIDAAVGVAFDAAKPVAESYARVNAPWRDVTGNARNGLMATHVSVPEKSHALIVYHTMDYGLWLEVRFSGRYAIIAPTVQHMGPVLKQMIAAAVQRAVATS